ncbi:MAG: hypothetical protein PHV39_01480 [Methanomicrobium sp.]|nr:hypothetical protein [Methanomicrobium sp.]
MTEESGDTKRRLIMMLTIILAGSAITFMDLSPIIVIIIAFGIGFVMLFALKMISFDELKKDLSNLKSRLNQPISLKKDKSKKSGSKYETKEKTEPKSKTSESKAKREIPFASVIQKIPFIGTKLSKDGKAEKKQTEKKGEDSLKKSFISGFTSIFGFLNRKKETLNKTKKIDELLDKTLSSEYSADAVEAKNEETDSDHLLNDENDEFSDFDNLDLGLEEDDDALTSKGGGAIGFEEEISDSTIADILAKEGIELELDDEEFPTASPEQDDSGNFGDSSSGIQDIDELNDDVSGLDLNDGEFDEFNEIDLDELEPEDEIEFGEEEAIEDIDIGDSDADNAEPPVAPVEEEDILSVPPKEWTQTKTSAAPSSDDNIYESPMSLALGGDGDDDDLFAMLKSDTKKAVSVQELSLVRDLKDAKIESGELVEELEDILEQFGIEKEIKKDINENINEGDINN